MIQKSNYCNIKERRMLYWHTQLSFTRIIQVQILMRIHFQRLPVTYKATTHKSSPCLSKPLTTDLVKRYVKEKLMQNINRRCMYNDFSMSRLNRLNVIAIKLTMVNNYLLSPHTHTHKKIFMSRLKNIKFIG